MTSFRIRVALAASLLILKSGSCSQPNDHIRLGFFEAMGGEVEANFRKRLLDNAHPVTDPLRALADAQQNNDDDMINVENYSVKYIGCQNINTWSDNKAADEDSVTVFAMQRFVVFRMCPASHCSTYFPHGCNGKFGEYMIPMESWLQIMAQYHYSRFDEYCSTCAVCMAEVQEEVAYQYKAQEGNNVRRLADDDAGEGDDAVVAESPVASPVQAQANAPVASPTSSSATYPAEAPVTMPVVSPIDAPTSEAAPTEEQTDDFYSFIDDDYYKDDDFAGGNGQGSSYSNSCRFAGACWNYEKVCSSYNADDMQFPNYFQCSQFMMGDRQVYLGPHCNGDGHSITLGVFDDEECSDYLGNIANRQAFTGLAFKDDSLSFYYPKTCISCADQGHWTLHNEDAGGDAYSSGLCEALYDASAKCNKHIDSSSETTESTNQDLTEDTVCSFIQSLEENHYDEYGEINLANMYFDSSQWADYHQYTKFVTPLQIFGLVVSISLFLGLLCYSCCLHNSLVRAEKLSKDDGRAAHSRRTRSSTPRRIGQIVRISSGITRDRSHSESWAANHALPMSSSDSSTSSQRKLVE